MSTGWIILGRVKRSYLALSDAPVRGNPDFGWFVRSERRNQRRRGKCLWVSLNFEPHLHFQSPDKAFGGKYPTCYNPPFSRLKNISKIWILHISQILKRQLGTLSGNLIRVKSKLQEGPFLFLVRPGQDDIQRGGGKYADEVAGIGSSLSVRVVPVQTATNRTREDLKKEKKTYQIINPSHNWG